MTQLVARLDGRRLPDKAAFLAALAAGLRFPDYFGGNLDALEECLGDLPDFAPAEAYEVRIDHAAAACPGRREDFDAVLAVLKDAAARPDPPLKVVLTG